MRRKRTRYAWSVGRSSAPLRGGPNPVMIAMMSSNMPVAATPLVALLVKGMDFYQELGYRLTLLEIQKLAYFLQESGEPLRLCYEAGHYGPYAQNLNDVLERIEGHFIRGYGDSLKPDVEIDLLDGAVEQADEFLREHSESKQRLERVSALISGFETPYGMELLSSVHWVAAHREPKAQSAEAATDAVHGWNDRKRNMFKPEHIAVAWERLCEEQWVPKG